MQIQNIDFSLRKCDRGDQVVIKFRFIAFYWPSSDQNLISNLFETVLNSTDEFEQVMWKVVYSIECTESEEKAKWIQNVHQEAQERLFGLHAALCEERLSIEF